MFQCQKVSVPIGFSTKNIRYQKGSVLKTCSSISSNFALETTCATCTWARSSCCALGKCKHHMVLLLKTKAVHTCRQYCLFLKTEQGNFLGASFSFKTWMDNVHWTSWPRIVGPMLVPGWCL